MADSTSDLIKQVSTLQSEVSRLRGLMASKDSLRASADKQANIARAFLNRLIASGNPLAAEAADTLAGMDEEMDR